LILASAWSSEGGAKRGFGHYLDFENFIKKVVFLYSSGKTHISPLLAPPLEIFWKNLPVPPLEKILPTPMGIGFIFYRKL